MFLLALAATAAGALLDGLTPSYDASIWWSWGSDGLSLVAEAMTLIGLLSLARGLPVKVLLVLGTAGVSARFVVHELPEWLPEWLPMVAAALLAIGHFLLFWPLRKKLEASAQALPATAATGLLRWGLILWAHFLCLGAAVIAAVFLRENQAEKLGVLAVLLGAVIAAAGLRWLERFSDGAQALGARVTFARAAPLASVVVALFIVPNLLEAWVVDRDSAWSRAGVAAVSAEVLSCIALISLVGAIRRTARIVKRSKLARFARILRFVLIGLPLALASTPFLELMFSWEWHHFVREELTPLLAIAFVLSWLGTLIFVILSGRALRSHGAPGSVGEKVANAT